MREFRRLFLAAAASGTLAGLLWFAAQYVAVIPLIEQAEAYEAASRHAPDHDEGWHPAAGRQRDAFTAAATVLTGIAFAALLSAAVSLAGRGLNARSGALWGLAGFACFSLAPALGLPPRPPGVAVADLFDRQIWWAATVAATAAGLYLIAGSRAWLLRLGGLICLALPHAVGAPTAHGETVVPRALVERFALASVASAALFWVALGMLSGIIGNGMRSRPAAAN